MRKIWLLILSCGVAGATGTGAAPQGGPAYSTLSINVARAQAQLIKVWGEVDALEREVHRLGNRQDSLPFWRNRIANKKEQLKVFIRDVRGNTYQDLRSSIQEVQVIHGRPDALEKALTYHENKARLIAHATQAQTGEAAGYWFTPEKELVRTAFAP